MDKEFAASLKNNKRFFTQQRRVVLEELEKSDNHLTADQVYSLVKKRMPKVSVGTIYRNLSVLVDLDFVDKVDTTLHAESHYEAHKDPHYHIVCTKCLTIDDLEHYRALSIEPTAEKISGYKISNHQIEFHGICKKCQEVVDSLDYKKPVVDNYALSTNTKPTSEPNNIINQKDEIHRNSNPQVKSNSINLNLSNPNSAPSNQNTSKSKKKNKRKFFFGRQKNKY